MKIQWDIVLPFLDYECLDEEREAFFIALRYVAQDPIKRSQPWLGRTNKTRIVRFFRFGGCRAYFEYHWTGDERTDWIEVIACQRSR